MSLNIFHKKIIKVSKGSKKSIEDQIAVESPMEIRVKQQLKNGLLQKRLAVTMRTPGNDLDLIRGFLFTEGVIQGKD